MLSISLPGGSRETFPRDDGIRRSYCSCFWLGDKGHTSREMSVRSEGFRRVYGDWTSVGLDTVFHSVSP